MIMRLEEMITTLGTALAVTAPDTAAGIARSPQAPSRGCSHAGGPLHASSLATGRTFGRVSLPGASLRRVRPAPGYPRSARRAPIDAGRPSTASGNVITRSTAIGRCSPPSSWLRPSINRSVNSSRTLAAAWGRRDVPDATCRRSVRPTRSGCASARNPPAQPPGRTRSAWLNSCRLQSNPRNGPASVD